MNKLPAGYVEIDGFASVHLSILRKFSTDEKRFRRLLPTVRKLNGLEPGSDEATAVFLSLSESDRQGFITTLKEYGKLSAAIFTNLKDGKLDSEFPQVFYSAEFRAH